MRKLKLEELGRLSVGEFREAEKHPVCVVLDNIRSMHNVGSVFRSSDAFAVEKVWLCGYTAKPPHRDIRKVAIGAEESVEWEWKKDITEVLRHLKDEGWTLIAIEQTSESVELGKLRLAPQQKTAFIFGNEVGGVSDPALALCDSALEIPQFGTKHSLNISVTVGIVLYQAIIPHNDRSQTNM